MGSLLGHGNPSRFHITFILPEDIFFLMLVNSVTHLSSAGNINNVGPILQVGINTTALVTKRDRWLRCQCRLPAVTISPLKKVKKCRVGFILPSLNCLKTTSLD